MNVAALLAHAADAYPEHPAIALGERPWATYRELARRAATIARGLRERHGLAPGDRVAIAMANRPAYLEALFAAWHAGLVAVPVNAKLHRCELAFVLGHSGSRLAVVTPELHDTVASLIGEVEGLEAVLCSEDDAYARLGQGDPTARADAAPTDPAWLFYTSGTTGRPKGATLTHRNLLAMTLAYYADIDALGPRDAILHAAPLSHGSGLYALAHLAKAACNVIPESGGFEPDETFALIAAHPRVSFFAAPTMVTRLLNAPGAARADMSNLRTIVYGGGPMYVADLERALSLWGPRLAQIFGQGESPMTITALSKEQHADTAHPRRRDRLASVGYPRTGVEVGVVDEEDRALPAGGPGEVVVRGDVVMPGYWADAAASAEALRGGWLHTGDVGILDPDGFLTLHDRLKDLVISGGANVYPREIEEVLLRSPDVLEASVVGRPHPEWGEEVVAFVVPRPGRALDEGALERLCLEHVARFKRPREYIVTDALPKNNYGKVLKTELRRRLAT